MRQCCHIWRSKVTGRQIKRDETPSCWFTHKNSDIKLDALFFFEVRFQFSALSVFFSVSSWGCSVERCALLGFCWGAWLVCHACGSFNFCCGAMASLGVDCGPFCQRAVGVGPRKWWFHFFWPKKMMIPKFHFFFLGERDRERAIYISKCHEWWVKWVFEDHDFVRFVNIKSRILRHPSVHNLVLRWGEDQECFFFFFS